MELIEKERKTPFWTPNIWCPVAFSFYVYMGQKLFKLTSNNWFVKKFILFFTNQSKNNDDKILFPNKYLKRKKTKTNFENENKQS